MQNGMPPRFSNATAKKAVMGYLELLLRNYPVKRAEWLAAEALGCSPRWIRGLRAGEPAVVPDDMAAAALCLQAQLIEHEQRWWTERREALLNARGGGDAGLAVSGAYGALEVGA